jgi:hypothetical protein
MNGRIARELRRVASWKTKDEGARDATVIDSGKTRVIGQLHPDGSVTQREERALMVITNESRYIYRQLKKEYNKKSNRGMKLASDNSDIKEV